MEMYICTFLMLHENMSKDVNKVFLLLSMCGVCVCACVCVCVCVCVCAKMLLQKCTINDFLVISSCQN